MKTFKFFRWMLPCMILIGYFACQKVDVNLESMEENHLISESNPYSSNTRIVGGHGIGRNAVPDDDQIIVLGNKRDHPFTKETMTQAFINLQGFTPEEMPITDLYVRFLPETIEELDLLETYEFPVFDFPLDYEVIEDGDYYHDPALEEDKITWQYAVVKPDFVFPDITYEILEELVLPPYESYLTAEAFRIKKLPYSRGNPKTLGDGGNPNNGGGNNNPEWECADHCASWPCCLIMFAECDDDSQPCLDIDINLDCYPGLPDYPGCLTPSTGGGNSTWSQSDCGCTVWSDERKPGGCIQVVDTQLPANSSIDVDGVATDVHLAGVRDVKIKWYNGYFKTFKTRTDENGCWKINYREKGKGKLTIKFKGDRVSIRGVRGAKAHEYALAIKDKHTFHGPRYNDIQIVYTPFKNHDNEGQAKKKWYAATFNNAVHEYDDYATDDNIGLPSQGLKVLLTNYNSTAAAPMFAQIKKNPLIYFTVQGILGAGIDGGSLAASTVVNFLYPSPILTSSLPLATHLVYKYIRLFPPDIVYNYGEHPDDMASDQIKETAYHELGHAAHFEALDNDLYWLGNIAYIAWNATTGNNPPYGDGSGDDAEKTAIIESWGSTAGRLYADRTYGVHHSNGGGTFEAVTALRHLYLLEAYDPTSSDPDAWIPDGIFLDCVDNNQLNPINVDDPVQDLITGFSLSNCFDVVAEGHTKVEHLRESLKNNFLPGGATNANVDLLFSEYGF